MYYLVKHVMTMGDKQYILERVVNEIATVSALITQRQDFLRSLGLPEKTKGVFSCKELTHKQVRDYVQSREKYSSEFRLSDIAV